MVSELIIYSTDHCALCEQALDLLLSMPELRAWAVCVIDVAGDDGLLDRYGERLPVLAISTDESELNWPFDEAAIRGWLRTTK